MEFQAIIYFILLFLITSVLYALPFLPAIMEWINKTDIEPFNVAFEDETFFDYLVRLFRIYIQANYSDIIHQNMNSDENYQALDKNGKEFQFTGRPGLVSLGAAETLAKMTSRLFIFWQDAMLPDGVAFKNKIYARGCLTTGQNNRLNEVLVEGDLFLRDGTISDRLLYSGHQVTVGQHSVINGYVKARDSIFFLGRNEFQSVCAKNICFGQVTNPIPAESIDVIGDLLPRQVEKKKYRLTQGTQMTSHFVVYGTFNIEQDCVVKGSIKSHEDIVIGNNSRIIGAVFCEKDIYIGDNCVIQGPVISNGNITFGHHCIIGTDNTPTSVVAENIQVGTGCYFTGTLLAKMQGIYSFNT